MKYDFDKIVNRENTNCLKYDFKKERGYNQDVMPLWIADMDFKTADEIIEGVNKAISHGIYGYSEVKNDYFNIVHNWMLKYFSFDIKEEWLVKTPGVVYALCCAVKAYAKEKEGVMVQQPIYGPFKNAIIDNGRRLVNCPLIYKNYRYTIDFEAFEQSIIEEKVKLFLFCNPHNPVGRVWNKEELMKIGEICYRHNVIIVSDEIHQDFIYPGYQHHSIANLDPRFLEITVTCTGPTKTFNLAGIQVSNIIIQNEELRNKFVKEIAKTGVTSMNIAGLTAVMYAYKYGEEWLEQLKSYLYDNLCFIRKFINEHLHNIVMIEPDGTYLVWLDCSGLGLSDSELEDFIRNKAKLWLNRGELFGEESRQFQRINIACPRAVLKKALERLQTAVESLEK